MKDTRNEQKFTPEQDARDAARYRWLRQGDNDDLVFQRVGSKWDDVFLPRLEKLDAAIDMRMMEEGSFTTRVVDAQMQAEIDRLSAMFDELGNRLNALRKSK